MFNLRHLKFDRIVVYSVIICISNAFFSLLTVGKETTGAYKENKSLIYVLIFLYLLCFFKIFVRFNMATKLMEKSKPILVMLLLSFASSLWSENAMFTAQKSIALVLTYVFSLYVVIYFSKKEFIEIIFNATFCLMSFSVLFCLLFPDLSVQTDLTHSGNWRGVFPQKQVLGQMAVVCCIFSCLSIYYNMVHRKKAYMALFLSSLCLYMSQSRTAWGLFILLLVFMFFDIFRDKFNKYLYASFFVFLGLVFFMFLITLLDNVNAFFVGISRDATLSGRVPLWEYGMSRFWLNPITGEGYKSFWLTNADLLNYLFGYRVVNGHNLWIDIALELGSIGILSVLFFFGSYINRSWVKEIEFSKFDKMCFLFVFLFGFVATIFPNPNSIYTSLLFAFFMYNSRVMKTYEV